MNLVVQALIFFPKAIEELVAYSTLNFTVDSLGEDKDADARRVFHQAFDKYVKSCGKIAEALNLREEKLKQIM